MAITFDKLTATGQDSPMKEPVQAYDAMAGVYHDPVDALPVEERLGMRANPRAPDPMPLGNLRAAK